MKEDVISTKKIILIVFFGTLINVLGKTVAGRLSLPIWFDALGTVMAAYYLGSYAGAVTGLAGNIIYGLFADGAMVYGITSAIIGVIVGISVRKGRLNSFFGVMITSTIVAFASIAVSTPLNILLYEGSTGNIWGNGVSDFFIEKGLHPLIAYFFGEFYLDFPDKVFTIGLFWLYLKIRRRIESKQKIKPVKIKSAAAILLAVIIPFSAVIGTVNLRADENDDTTEAEEETEDEMTVGDDLYSYVQTVYTSYNGLSCGEANDVASTPDGILWIGTYAGLYRYNGRSFNLMDFSSVKNVNCLFVDDEGRIWIGTNDNGLSVCIGEKISNVVDRESGLPSNSVRSIMRSSDGYYYVGTADALQIIQLDGGLNMLETIDEVNYAHDISADKNGNVVAVTSAGDMFLIREKEVVKKEVLSDESGIYMCSCFDEDGNLYVGDSKGIIRVFDITGDNFSKIGEYKFSAISGINKIYISEDGTVFACAESGIGYIKTDGKSGYISPDSFQSSIDSMTQDYQGNLWFTSSRLGLLRLSKSPFYDYYGAGGKDRNVVNSVTIWNGFIYAGTDGGLDCINESTGVFVDNELTEEFAGLRIRCILADSSDNLWICTYGRGLYRVNDSGKMTTYSETNGLFCDWVRVCIELKDGSIAAAGDGGLIIIKDGEIQSLTSLSDLGLSAMILTMCEQSDGTILLGSDGDGIVGFKDGTVAFKLNEDNGLSSGVVLRIKPTADKSGWYVVTSNGINYMNRNYYVRYLENFPYSNNYDVETTAEGTLYVLGSAGIYIVNENSLLNGGKNMVDYELLDSNRGLQFALTVNSHNLHTNDDMLYISGDDGVYRLDLYDYGSLQKSYRMKMAYITVDGVAYPVERGTDIVIPRDAERIVFSPEIINYTLEDPIINYRLSGVDSTYISVPLSEFNGISYTGIPKGSSEFVLYILGDKGEILEQSRYTIVREKAFYDYWWFITYLYIISGMIIVWFTWLAARSRMKKFVDLQQKELNLAKQQLQLGNQTIMAIAKTVDAKDENTSHHSQRVSDYSALIASKMGFTPEEQENIRSAALLHDIGKIGIPDNILNKPSKLNDEEYEIMKSHASRGAEILKDFTMIEHASEGAKFHHERFDGKGYPVGLSGKNIPLYGRIIGVADAFDAMTQNRVYRKKLDVEVALDELKTCSGTQFDPEIAEIMIELVRNGEIDLD